MKYLKRSFWPLKLAALFKNEVSKEKVVAS
jgi:hypothetical protein